VLAGQTQFLLTAKKPAGHPTQDDDFSSNQEFGGQALQTLYVESQKPGAEQLTHLLSAVM
jgi:hypothetical protein